MSHPSYGTVLGLLILAAFGQGQVPTSRSGPCDERVHNLITGESFCGLQTAIDAAEPGDELVAEPGVYQQSIVLDKDILVRSSDPNDAAIIESTVIRGRDEHAVLISAGTMRGFTIRSGGSEYGMIASGTGTVARCVIRDIHSTLWYYPIVRVTDSAIFRRNRVIENSSILTTILHGRQSAVIAENVLEENSCASLFHVQGEAIALRNVLRRNTADVSSVISARGASRFEGNLIYDNNLGLPRFKLEAYDAASVLNNTLVHQHGTMIGMAADATVRGNIIVAKTSEGPDPGWFGFSGTNSKADYNCLYLDAFGHDPHLYYTSSVRPGPHDVLLDPQLLEDADGLRLSADSPCVNAGDRAHAAVIGELDVLGQPRRSGGRIDIGAAEYQLCDPGCQLPGGFADLNHDCGVDLEDLAIVLATFSSQGPAAAGADTNGDAVIDLLDLGNVLDRFGIGCPEIIRADCNANLVDDSIDIASGSSADELPPGGDGVPDECQTE